MDKIHVQLYSFGHDSGLDVFGKIRAAAEMGYTGVEFAGDYRGVPAAEVKAVLDETGLIATTAHVGFDVMEEEIPYLAELGVKIAICPMAQFNSKEEAKLIADQLNKAGELAAKYGMKVGYHNHTDEYYVDDGKYLFDWLIEFSNPETSSFQVDCGWCSASGTDPVEFINSHKGRIGAIHIKENGDVIGADKPLSINDPSPWASLKFDEEGKPIFPEEFLKMMEARDALNVPQGTGIVDWKAVKAAADAQCDDVVYVVEREVSYGGKSRINCLKEDIAWIKANL